MNSKPKCISFTIEREENNSISFPDRKDFRDAEKLHFSVYRKPTFRSIFATAILETFHQIFLNIISFSLCCIVVL